MHTGLRLRRVASGVFILALFALLIVPVGSVARLPHAQTAASSPNAKVTTVAARTHHAISHDNTSDRFQLDPVTPLEATVEFTQVTPGPIDHPSRLSAEIVHSDPTVRGPPAL